MTGSANGASSGRTPNLWAATALMGLAAFALIFWLSGLLPAQACPAAIPGPGPLGAFQAARTAQDVWAVFGAEPSACREALLASMDRVNRYDLFGYVPSSALLALGFLIGSRRAGRALAFALGLVALAVDAGGDALETAAQLAITAQIAAAPHAEISPLALTLLGVGNMAKIAGYPFVLLAAGLLWIGRGTWASVFAVLLLACAVFRFTPIFGPLPPPWGILGMLGWLVSLGLMTLAALWFAVVQRLPRRA